MLRESILAEAVPTRPRAAAPVRLELRGLRKRWGAAAPVLDDVDLDLHAGSVVALVGRNGAGKTTLLRIVAGLIAPDHGRVALEGLDPFADRREYQRRIGFVSAGHGGLYARLTARQHLECWSRLAFVPRRDRAAAVASAIERLDLGAKANARVDRLSAGQRQRLRVAMAFLHRPSLVLLDEPHTSLDEDGASALQMLVRQLADEGGTAVCCAPSVALLGLAVDDVHLVEDGKVLRA